MVAVAELCEACRSDVMSVEEESDEPTQPYKLCQNCHERLLKYSLRPIEWYNLAVIHSPKVFLLHDDFYDEDGEATQPEEDVIVTDKDMAPTLEGVRMDLELLLDFSTTRWFLEDDVIATLKEHDKISLLHSVKSRFYGTTNYEVQSRMLEIVADVLGNTASDWIRELWDAYDEDFLIHLSWATSSALPPQEGLGRVFEKLEGLTEKELPLYAFSCLYRFRSNEVLDWIETNCKMFHDNWGRLAALSFPTWERMKLWLNMGRPLSLVALDALASCANKSGDTYVREFNPKILHANMDEIKFVLDNYYQKDSVVRVRNKRDIILNNKEDIFDSFQ